MVPPLTDLSVARALHLPAARSASWWCTSIPAASRPTMPSVSRSSMAAAVVPSKSPASSRLSVLTSRLAGSRPAGWAPCRWCSSRVGACAGCGEARSWLFLFYRIRFFSEIVFGEGFQSPAGIKIAIDLGVSSPTAAVDGVCPQRATAAPWLSSLSRRRPPLGPCGVGEGVGVLPRLRWRCCRRPGGGGENSR
jgi:hypothetical protein